MPSAFLERLRVALDLLEAIAADRSVLDEVPDDDFARFLRAVTQVRNPRSRTRRRLAKAAERNERVARAKRDEAVRANER